MTKEEFIELYYNFVPSVGIHGPTYWPSREMLSDMWEEAYRAGYTDGKIDGKSIRRDDEYTDGYNEGYRDAKESLDGDWP